MSSLSATERKLLAQQCVQMIVDEVEASAKRIQPYIHRTPLERSRWLSNEKNNTSVYLKLENNQLTGTFKIRGAMNKMCCLKEDAVRKGSCSVVTASAGNHGLACALTMNILGFEGKIVLPEIAKKYRVDAIEQFGTKVELFGDDCVKAEAKAKQYASENENVVYISPYADVVNVRGHGTIGLEILEDLPNVDTVFVTVGGGGLISGIATYLKTVQPSVKIIGCQPKNSCVMFESVKAGKILDLASYPTLSDSSAGGVDPDSFTFDICCEYVDEWVIVSEEEISEAMFFMLQKQMKLIEGAAAVSVAAFRKTRLKHVGENVVVVICGGNVAVETVKEVIDSNIGHT